MEHARKTHQEYQEQSPKVEKKSRQQDVSQQNLARENTLGKAQRIETWGRISLAEDCISIVDF
jgi:hypothetical protein